MPGLLPLPGLPELLPAGPGGQEQPVSERDFAPLPIMDRMHVMYGPCDLPGSSNRGCGIAPP